MLYNSGKIQFTGEVDSGTTITDFLDQERQRGISITSATATINWNDHQINLIDTPGHVDFTLEVERSLAVLDGAVTVLDGVKGVEAQTTTVWSQAKNHKIPNIFYINKFDRKNANLNFCLNSITKKLPNTIPLLIHLPFFNKETNRFCGIVDVINFNLEFWDLTNQSQVVLNESFSRQISDSEELFEQCIEARQRLLETLVNLDDGVLSEEFLMLHDPKIMIPPKLITDSIRKSTISTKASPVIIGSSRMNIGVNNILDKIISFLPDPTEKEICPRFASLAAFPNHFTALAFKVSHDKFKGPLTFLRIYSGILTPGKSLSNVTRSVVEKVGKIIQITGDQFTELQSAEAGNIVAISGLRNCYTGDLLVDPKMPSLSSNEEKYLDLITIPTAVIYASIEASGLSEIRKLENALTELSKEDPSLSFHKDEETHQLILGGMGKLHLEIIYDRIINDYKLPNSRLGKVRIAYRECPIIESNICHEHQAVEKIHGQPLQISIKISASAYKNFDVKSDVGLVNSREFNWSIFDEKVIRLIKETALKAINVGGSKMRSPVTGINLIIHHIITDPDDKLLFNKNHQALLRSCVMEAARGLLKKVPTNLLEPMMKLDISFNSADSNTPLYSANVFGDLHKRRARIVGTYSLNNDSHIDHLTAYMPLIETEEYSSILRSLTSGTASLHMSYSHYDIMSQEAQDNVTRKIFYQSKYI